MNTTTNFAGVVMDEKTLGATAFKAASEVLPPITDDDCNVILQDWDETDSDQRVSMRLAAELLSLRRAAREALRALLTGQPGPITDDVLTYNLDGLSCGSALKHLRAALRIT